MRPAPATPRAALLALLALSLGGAACGFQEGPGLPSENDPPINPTPLGPGRIFVAWSIDGRSPDPALCGNIDRLSLKLSFRDGTRVKIEPIPCVLDRFRYDGMPLGNADLTLTGFDPRGCVLTEGAATVAISSTQPTTPAPTVALPSPGGCP